MWKAKFPMARRIRGQSRAVSNRNVIVGNTGSVSTSGSVTDRHPDRSPDSPTQVYFQPVALGVTIT